MPKDNSGVKSKSIKVKLLIVPLCSVLIGIFVIGGISAYLTRNSLLAEMRENGFSASQQFVDRIEDNSEALKTMNDMIEEQIRSIGNIVIGNQGIINDQYLTTLAQQSGIDQIYWFNPAGEIISAVNGEYVGWKAAPGDPIHNFMISGNTEFMEDIRKSTETDESFKFGYIKTGTGGFVQAGVTADRVMELTQKFGYQALIDEMSSADSIVYATFVDKNLVGIADSNPDLIGKSYAENENIKASALEGKSSAFEYFYDVEQIDVYDVLYPVVINGELVGALDIGYSMSTINAAISKNITLVFIAGMLVFFIVGFILYKISASITKPVVEMNHMIKEMSMGHLGMRLNIKNRDEIGEMAIAMDQFAEDLQHVFIGTLKQISAGDVSAEIQAKDDLDEITPALKQTIETIKGLITEAIMLSHAAVEGHWDIRGNAEAFRGGFKEVVEGVNATLDTVVDKMIWYESIIDAVPFPIHVTDNDMKWTFMNKPFEAMMINNNVITDRTEGCGMDCYNAGANICRTEGCGIRRLVDQGLADSYFEWYGRNYKQDTAYLMDAKGAKVGFVEVVTDLTAIIRVSDYTKNEVTRLGNNLIRLSEGDLAFDMAVGAADEYTKEVSAQFNEIRNSLEEVQTSVENLISDTVMLAQAGIDGRLNTRADASRHQGDFAKIVDGVNATLDAVIAPVQEASDTLKELARGNLNTGMVGNYNGDYTVIRDDMNQTIGFLKRYVDEITQTLEKVGQGNLDLEITANYLGDFSAIKAAINGITTSISITMKDIDDAASQVEIGARQISDGGQALSQGTTEQASSIEELTASIEEVAGETKKNAMRANEANERAVEVHKNAEVGNSQMEKMVSAMVEINDSSRNISKIIKVIDDIAFQTNILALNAAVEAARAGQQGKGFAVVAEEVRNLAARSAVAVMETTVLIEGSIEKVQEGSKIADETAVSLSEILREIEKVAGLVGTIAQASNDQASEIAQINQGIEQVSQVVQTNSATAEESAAASEELSGQALMLKEMVGAFKLK
ncbi:methyl-accepting chemotaxis protein [Acetobacterium bakii]|uniref:methyl-accepting chemotaxis protein n=1 Tax=Acetobacterium bakii TaxID=52689 RepID=UPI00068290E2|nr:methyl-accepting chemotaxis protein [Acetobacterium bakii]